MSRVAFDKSTFSARGASLQRFLDAVLPRLPASVGLRVLDLGCGSGQFSFALHRARPDLLIEGIDISNENIRAAEAERQFTETGNIHFESADFMAWQGRKFEVLMADSVLHLIEADDAHLARQLADSLMPGGLIIATMPSRSLKNSLLILPRHIWRLLPNRFDKVALALASLVYPKESKSILADRIGYLRIVPPRLYDRKFTRILEEAGLLLREDTAYTSAAALKPRHRLLVFVRPGAPEITPDLKSS